MKSVKAAVLFLVFFCWTGKAWAWEFDEITFLEGVLPNERQVKYISLEKENNLRFYISSDRQVDFIDRRSGSQQLFAQADNPLLVYRIETDDSKTVFYAIFDRSVDHAMRTSVFSLLGSVDGSMFAEFINLDTLREAGWTSAGLRLRLEKKELIIEGVTRTKTSPDNVVEPVLARWDETAKKFKLSNEKIRQDAENLAKRLTETDFSLAGLQLGDPIAKATEQYGSGFTVSERSDVAKDKIFIAHDYKKLLTVRFDENDGSIWEIAGLNADLLTARGVAVGMEHTQLWDKYGTDYKISRQPEGIHFIYSGQGLPIKAQIGFILSGRGKIIKIYITRLE
jgi:hypothetical protein